MKRRLIHALCLFSLTLISGCTHLGPKFLPGDQMAYNRQLNQSLSSQLFLNIIRDRYHEPDLYMRVSNISSSRSLSRNVNLSGMYPFIYRGFKNTAMSLGGSYSESPSFIFQPEVNGQYMSEALIPIKLREVFFVIKTESSLGDIFRMSFQRIGAYRNFPYHAKLKQGSNNKASIANFIAIARALNHIYEDNGHQLYLVKAPSRYTKPSIHHGDNLITLNIPPHNSLSSKEWATLNLIHVHRGDREVSFSSYINDPTHHIVRVSVRSLLGLTDFLSQGIPPLPGQKQRRDYQPLLMDNLFRIHYSRGYPLNAYLAVYFDGRWYYIEKNDTQSKIVFRLYRMFNDVTQGSKNSAQLLIST